MEAIREFKKRIPCLLCGAKESATAFYIRRDKYLVDLKTPDPSVRYKVCKNCGLVFQNPRITHDVESALYTHGQYRGFSANPPADWLETHLRFAEREVKWISESIGYSSGGGRRALEIGAGAGFGAVALQRAGWEAVGVEPDQDLAAFGRARYGLNILGEFFSEESFSGEMFSLIVSFQVFEHLLDPLEILRVARRKIEPDGYLHINVPTFRRCHGKLMWRKFASPHICIFTHKTLGNLLAKAGFQIFRFEYDVDGMLRVLAQPSRVFDEFPYKEKWRLIPLEIFFQGFKYFLARYIPSRVFQGIQAIISKTLGKKQGAALNRVVRLKVWIKRQLGLHIWEQC